jgi:ribose 5-phosphate isomerase A
MILVMEKEGALRAKRAAGERAAELVEDGMVVGLGTGSTVKYAMDRLAERQRKGLRFLGIPTSFQTAIRARDLGIPLTSLDDHPDPEIAIDGADQVDRDKRLIKGRGAALTREKIVAAAAARLVIVVDRDKMVETLHGVVPTEVLPFALVPVLVSLKALGAAPVVREGVAKDGPVVSDNGGIIVDADFGQIRNPGEVECAITMIPGVICTGLFTAYTGKTSVVVGGEKGEARIL